MEPRRQRSLASARTELGAIKATLSAEAIDGRVVCVCDPDRGCPVPRRIVLGWLPEDDEGSLPRRESLDPARYAASPAHLADFQVWTGRDLWECTRAYPAGATELFNSLEGVELSLLSVVPIDAIAELPPSPALHERIDQLAKRGFGEFMASFLGLWSSEQDGPTSDALRKKLEQLGCIEKRLMDQVNDAFNDATRVVGAPLSVPEQVLVPARGQGKPVAYDLREGMPFAGPRGALDYLLQPLRRWRATIEFEVDEVGERHGAYSVGDERLSAWARRRFCLRLRHAVHEESDTEYDLPPGGIALALVAVGLVDPNSQSLGQIESHVGTELDRIAKTVSVKYDDDRVGPSVRLLREVHLGAARRPIGRPEDGDDTVTG